MNKRTFSFIFAALFLLTTLLAGCSGAKAPTGESKDPAPAAAGQDPAPKAVEQPGGGATTTYPITVVDDAGRQVTIQAEPKRIISNAPSNTELLFALGKGDVLVGRSDFCDFPAEAAQIESIGGFFPPNYEKIISLKPDLVIMISGSEQERTKLEEEYKLTTLVVNPNNFGELYDGVKMLGQVVNAQEAAEKLIADIQAAVKAVEEKASKATTKPVVFYEVWHDPLMTAGPGSYIDDMIRIAGGTNAAASASSAWAEFSMEQMAAANPGIIITGSADAAKVALERKGWESLKAVKEGKVFGLPDENLVVRPGPRLIQGLNWFAQQIQPELFAR